MLCPFCDTDTPTEAGRPDRHVHLHEVSESVQPSNFRISDVGVGVDEIDGVHPVLNI
jgi:hypothetical protein